jgi:hypothetical protein
MFPELLQLAWHVVRNGLVLYGNSSANIHPLLSLDGRMLRKRKSGAANFLLASHLSPSARQEDAPLERVCPRRVMDIRMKRRAMMRSLAMIAIALATACTVGVAALLAGEPEGGAPPPPRVDFVPLRASQLHLGMAPNEVARIMGDATQTKTFRGDNADIRILEFPAMPIATKVTLTGGKVSGVALDITGDDGGLPAFSRRAWTGMHSVAVGYLLGTPSEIRHHTFSGSELEQRIFQRPGEPTVSVFLINDHVVAKRLGRAVPVDIFRVTLPLPPDSRAEEPIEGLAMVGMAAGDVRALYGAVKRQVGYSFKGQPAEHVIYETRAGGSFASFTFVGGALTEFADLGRRSIDEAAGD